MLFLVGAAVSACSVSCGASNCVDEFWKATECLFQPFCIIKQFSYLIIFHFNFFNGFNTGSFMHKDVPYILLLWYYWVLKAIQMFTFKSASSVNYGSSMMEYLCFLKKDMYLNI